MNDYNLAQSCANGDHDAWERFVKKYASFAMVIIKRTASFYNAALGQEDCDDILADIFLDLVKKPKSGLASYRGESSLATWLRKVVSNKTINHLRKMKTPPKQLQDLPDIESGADDPSEVRAKKHAVIRTLTQLNSKERLVVKLYFFEQRKYKEIAKIMGIPIGSVGPTLSRALISLRNIMDE